MGKLATLSRAAVLAAAIAAVVCYPAWGAGARHHDLTVVSMKTGVFTDDAPLFIGVNMGFFAKQGIDLRLTSDASSGSLLPPLMVSGQYQFGSTSPFPFIVAQSAGLGFKFIGDLTSSRVKDPTLGLFVRPGSEKVAKDFIGKNVCIPSLNSSGQLVMSNWFATNGVDPSLVHYVAVPTAGEPQAIVNGICDSGSLASPTTGQAIALGLVKIGSPYVAFGGLGNPLQIIVTTSAYAAANPTIVAGFYKALVQSVNYAKAHPAAVRAVLPSYAGIDAATAATTALPLFDVKPSLKDLQSWANQGLKFGLITNPVNVKTDMMWSGAATYR